MVEPTLPGEAPRVVCGAVHPDAYRRAVCSLDDGHNGYHATEDGRLRWEVAPPGSKGAVQCVTIDRTKRDHVLTYGEPKADLGAAVARGEARARQVVDEMMATLYPAGQLRTAVYGGGTNRHARRKAAKRGARNRDEF